MSEEIRGDITLHAGPTAHFLSFVLDTSGRFCLFDEKSELCSWAATICSSSSSTVDTADYVP